MKKEVRVVPEDLDYWCDRCEERISKDSEVYYTHMNPYTGESEGSGGGARGRWWFGLPR